MRYAFDFRVLLANLGLLLSGAGLTMGISALVMAISTAIGIAGAVARLSRWRPASALSAAYVEVMRNTPLLLLLYVVYYGTTEIRLELSALTAGIVALSLNSGGYMTEIIRGGILGVGRGEVEAALSLGMRPYQSLGLIVIPHALRLIYPALINQLVGIILGSSLVYLIAVPELTYQSLTIGSLTGRYFELFAAVGLGYIGITQLLSRLSDLAARRLGLLSAGTAGGRHHV